MLFILRRSISFYNVIITKHVPLLTNLLINNKVRRGPTIVYPLLSSPSCPYFWNFITMYCILLRYSCTRIACCLSIVI